MNRERLLSAMLEGYVPTRAEVIFLHASPPLARRFTLTERRLCRLLDRVVAREVTGRQVREWADCLVLQPELSLPRPDSQGVEIVLDEILNPYFGQLMEPERAQWHRMLFSDVPPRRTPLAIQSPLKRI